ncbi:hypothetical protein CEXT_739701 [Caerostris extrusa]|uniref:Uncharacterized protein n=1 Tax=Caerostris extrusa TaxID=172846 RepID=A0AAV4U8N9_CAEEX|nr:hypothetical protein CEXT_739701 [Caerostris extrusa]
MDFHITHFVELPKNKCKPQAIFLQPEEPPQDGVGREEIHLKIEFSHPSCHDNHLSAGLDHKPGCRHSASITELRNTPFGG